MLRGQFNLGQKERYALKKIFLAFLFFCCVAIASYISVKDSMFTDLDTCFKASVSKKTICAKNSDYVKISNVSPYFLEAVVMSEDDKFYFHDGFDWKELKRSVLANLRKFSFVRGGSTITQQLVKNVYLSQEKSIVRKLKEAYIAHQIEKKYSKKLILEKYVNAIEFGKDLWGLKQASRFYFQKAPKDLGVLESLYLVILLPSPVKYSQSFFDGKLTDYQRKRISTLLSRFARRNIVDQDYATFLKEQLAHFPWKNPAVFEKPVAPIIEEEDEILIEQEGLSGEVEETFPEESDELEEVEEEPVESEVDPDDLQEEENEPFEDIEKSDENISKKSSLFFVGH